MSDEQRQPSQALLASRLRMLIEKVHPKGRGPYTYDEISEGIQKATGVSISGPYLSLLANGRRDNITVPKLEAIAKFFGVSPAYFFDDAVAQATTEQLEFMAAMRDSDVKNVAMRMLDLSPRSRQAALRIVTELQSLDEEAKPKRRGGRPRKDVDEPEQG